MRGLMQNWPLVVPSVIDHAARWHGEREMVSRTVEGAIHRTNYAQVHERARKLAQTLRRLGVGKGQVVATMAWNTHRHFEAWYAIMGAGAVCHTLNPRLFAEQLVYIINHAEDRILLLDTSFVALLESIQPQLPNVTAYILLTDRANMPETSLPNCLCYEDLIAAEDGNFSWVPVDEEDACGLCYTSGTTGNPKGVVYSHRSNVIHGLAVNCADGIGARSVDNVLPIVPMFHANAWGLVFAGPMAGCKLVMPGAKLDGESVCELLTGERVSVTAAVPTVWAMLLQYLEKTGATLPHLKRVIVGGSAVPRVMLEKFERDYGVEVVHAWGMTELSPVGTLASFKSGMEDLSFEEKINIKVKQGRPIYTVEMKVTDDAGDDLPHDGKAFGHLLVRGPAIAGSYLKGEGGKVLDEEGWFDTGDVATIDDLGFMQITDRAKDVIKSGGEWISSIEIENLAVGHPKVQEAAVIGVAHPKWDERPLLIVVPVPGSDLTREEIFSFLDGKIAEWWMPDDVAFVDEIPHTATGKIQKLTLRTRFAGYKLPTG